MKNIIEIAKSLGIEVPEDKAEELAKAVNENYKTVAEFDKTKAKLDDKTAALKSANEKIESLGEEIKGFEDSDEKMKSLQKKVSDYEEAEAQRKQAEEDRQRDEQLNAVIEDAIGDAEFVNDYTKASIIDEIKKGINENNGKGAKEIFAELTKDTEGILKNPQQNIHLPGGSGGGPASDDAELRAIMGLPPLGKE